jgi:hypothetical protein
MFWIDGLFPKDSKNVWFEQILCVLCASAVKNVHRKDAKSAKLL